MSDNEIDEHINQFFAEQEKKKRKPKLEIRRAIEDYNESKRLEQEFNNYAVED